MSKLIFNYSAMNAGKSASLLQLAHNYESSGLSILCFAFRGDDREGVGVIASRVGIRRNADFVFNSATKFTSLVSSYSDLNTIFIDEAQFLTMEQVLELTEITDLLGVNIICYGLRTDFSGEPFVGSTYLMAWADSLNELMSVDNTGAQASMNIRVNSDGERIWGGETIHVGYNYKSSSRKSFCLRKAITKV